jgi:hypothetical protein
MQGIQSTLLGLTFAMGPVAIALGAFSAGRALLLTRNGAQLRRSAVAERLAMVLCALCATVAVLMLSRGIRDANSFVLTVEGVLLAFAVAGLAAYFTSRRPLCEAFAAIAMGVLALLTGFSIGPYIAPFALAMGVLASHHSRIERRLKENGGR